MTHEVKLYEENVTGTRQDALDAYNAWCDEQVKNNFDKSAHIRTINVHITLAGFNKVHIEAYYEIT